MYNHQVEELDRMIKETAIAKDDHDDAVVPDCCFSPSHMAEPGGIHIILRSQKGETIGRL